MKLNKIKVYGKLRQDLGCSYFEAAVKSPLEAFRFLRANFPDLEKYMSSQYYKIKMNGNDISENNLTLQSNGVIQIIPVATGSVPIVIGAASLFASTVVPQTILGSALLGTVASAALSTVGTSLLVQGVTQMLTPTQQITYPTSSASTGLSRNDAFLADSNYSFSGISNISRAGVTLPVVYGEIFVGSILVSNGIDTDQRTNVSAVTSN